MGEHESLWHFPRLSQRPNSENVTRIDYKYNIPLLKPILTSRVVLVLVMSLSRWWRNRMPEGRVRAERLRNSKGWIPKPLSTG